ncbi:MAG: class I SAM-dependent methyltransferase [Myxococcales bacterium]
MEASRVSAGHEDRQREAYTRDAGRKLAEMEGHNRTYARKASVAAAEIVGACGAKARILEMGCGGGFFTRELALRLPEASIVASDAFEPMLEACADRVRGLPNVSLRKFDGRTAFPGEAAFDAVCAVDVIHHLADPAASLRLWRGLLRSGGALVALEANPMHPVLALQALPKPEERRFFLNSQGRLRRWTEAAGWQDVRVERIPLYLPAGPAALSRALDRAEDFLHRGRALWGFLSGAFLLRGRA